MSQDHPLPRLLPADDALRAELHNELHARPPARIRLPAMVVSVAVLNDGVTRADECEHLRRLPGQGALELERLRGQFLRLRFDNHSLKWERHSEFTRYSIAQPPPAAAELGASNPDLLSGLVTPPRWLQECSRSNRKLARVQRSRWCFGECGAR